MKPFKDNLPLDGKVNVAGYDYPLVYRGYIASNPDKCCVNTGGENIWVARNRITPLEESQA